MELQEKEKVGRESIMRGLYAQRIKHEEKVRYWEGIVKEGTSRLEMHRKKIVNIDNKIKNINNREVVLTTHFIERYHQRIGLATIEEIREHILTPQLMNMIQTLGNGKYPVHEYSVVVEDNKLLTIVVPDVKEVKKEKLKRYKKDEKGPFKKKARKS